MADWNKPELASKYVDFVDQVNARDADAAVAFDPAYTTPTNLPINTLRFRSAVGVWERWNGTTWVEAVKIYAINISGNSATVTNGVYVGDIGVKVPSLNGVGASGTWSINISGNAATATTATALCTTNSYQVSSLGIGVNPVSYAGSLTIGGSNSWGGAGYHTFLQVTNTYTGATNPNKYFRVNATGSIEVVNSEGNAVIFSIDNTGNITASGDISGFSDERLKHNWKNLDDDFIRKLASVKSGSYDRKDLQTRQLGVSAQSLRDVVPEAVIENDGGLLSVAYGNAALVACVELAKAVVALEAEIAELRK